MIVGSSRCTSEEVECEEMELICRSQKTQGFDQNVKPRHNGFLLPAEIDPKVEAALQQTQLNFAVNAGIEMTTSARRIMRTNQLPYSVN